MKTKGIGLLGAVFIVFLIFKLAEIGQVATWSWWWVTMPLWGLAAIGIALIILGVIFAGILNLITTKKSEPKHQTHKSKFQQRLEEAKANRTRLKNK